MNKEIKIKTIGQLLDYVETQEKAKELIDYITNLQERIDQYENPDDMTLFYMWLDIKAKDKIKALHQRIDKAIEYIKNNFEDDEGIICKVIDEYTCEANYNFLDDLLSILQGKDKREDK